MPTPMPRTLARDNTVSYFAGIAMLAVCLGLAFAWFLLSRTDRIRPDISFANVGPLVLSYQGYSFSTKLAIKTGADDAVWAAQNKQALEVVLQNTLAQTDPKQILAANGIGPLQTMLKDEINKAFQSGKVREVLLTDFVFASDE